MKSTNTYTEKALLEHQDQLDPQIKRNAFGHFKTQRDVLLGNPLRAQHDKPIDEDMLVLQNGLDFIKSLGFFSPAYIDNLVVYFVALTNPFFGTDYLVSIVDKYIKPDGRSAQSGALKKLAAAYFVYSVTHRNLKTPCTVGTAVRTIGIALGLDERVIERAHGQLKRGIKKAEKTE